ncbi:MAG: HNH endonuclease [Desulfomonile tiedjei]|nr:HNH endonuclease [Desulfomonile tiedjei]
MSRKKFIESQGATCRNWRRSWSFINEKEKLIIFGAWDKNTKGNTALILDEAWERNSAGRKNPAYPEAREHIRFVEEEGYSLKTFPIIYSDEQKDENGFGPSTIKKFEPKLTQKILKRVRGKWYASDRVFPPTLPEEIEHPETYIEGVSQTVSVNAYERNAKARAACIKHYGAMCVVCGFNFQTVYGEIGAGFIHVHHLVPLAEIKRQYELNPIRDLRPVCPNCHAIIHRAQPALTIDQLQGHIRRTGNA